MAKTIAKRGCTSFYLSKDTFNAVPISMSNSLKSEPNSTECSRWMLGVIDKKHGVGDVVFLTKFSQKLLRQ